MIYIWIYINYADMNMQKIDTDMHFCTNAISLFYTCFWCFIYKNKCPSKTTLRKEMKISVLHLSFGYKWQNNVNDFEKLKILVKHIIVGILVKKECAVILLIYH